MTTVAVLDYGSGNLHSVAQALGAAGAEVQVTADLDQAERAPGLVLPGVGAFAACMAQLTAIGADALIRRRVEAGRPLLAICVGHQVLFSAGVEHGVDCAGIGLFPGVVRRLPARHLPHMGWNEVRPGPGSRFFTRPERFYFVHSYAALSPQDLPPDAAAAWCDHDGVDFVAAAESGPVLSTQFHPEKSGRSGLGLLRRWLEAVDR